MTINSILLMNYVIFFLRCQIKIDNFDKTFPKRCRSFVRRRWVRLPGGIHRRRNPEKTEINISTLRVVASEGKYKHKDTKNVTLYEITSMPAVKRACLRRVTFSSWVIWLRSAWSAQQPKDSTLKDHKHVIITNMTITTNMFIVIIVIMIILIKPDQGWHCRGKLGCKGANSQAASDTELRIKVWSTELVPDIQSIKGCTTGESNDKLHKHWKHYTAPCCFTKLTPPCNNCCVIAELMNR